MPNQDNKNIPKIANIKAIDDIHIEIIQNHPIYPLHTHDFLECFLVVKGRGIHYCDGVYNLLLVGSFMIISENSQHSFIQTDELEIININLFSNYWLKRSPLLMRYIKIFYRYFITRNQHLTLSGQVYYKVKELILWAVKELNNPLLSGRNNQNMLVSTIMLQIFIIILQSDECITDLSSLNTERNLYSKQNIKHDVTDLIYGFHNFGLELNCNQFIQRRYRTYNTFLKYFKQITKYSPKSLQLKIVLFQSLQMILTRGNRSITDIAHSQGFTDMAYFSKIFKQEFNMNPSKIIQDMSSHLKL